MNAVVGMYVIVILAWPTSGHGPSGLALLCFAQCLHHVVRTRCSAVESGVLSRMSSIAHCPTCDEGSPQRPGYSCCGIASELRHMACM